MKTAVRLIDIARQAGVSVMTVSRVLHDSPEISVATKARVRALAQQLGYVPDVMARSLRTRTTRTLGVILPSLLDPSAPRLLHGIESRSREAGFDLLIAQSLQRPEAEDAAVQHFLARRVDGLFVLPAPRLLQAIPAFASLTTDRVRVVVLAPRSPAWPNLPNIAPDETLATTLATRHLLALGHRRIAYLSGPLTCPTAQARSEGYRRALREASMEIDDHLIFLAGATAEDGAKAARQVLDEAAHPTAILAVNDAVALGACQHFLAQALRIPEDLSIVGVGNFSASDSFRVPLTTVRVPKFQLGLAASDLMFRILRGEPLEHRSLPVELLIRASSGPAPSNLSPALTRTAHDPDARDASPGSG